MVDEEFRLRLHSYVVRFDSGFAPNPFFGFCTLATCKPDIRRTAQIGEWIVGTGSADISVGRGGFLVYAMRVTEALTFQQYWADPRFLMKRPHLNGSAKQACGDNIYSWNNETNCWNQLDSFHSRKDGSPNEKHIRRDTRVDRVLISSDYIYFGGRGPEIPNIFRNYHGIDICKQGRGRKIIEDLDLINIFEMWVRSIDNFGYVSPPFEW